MANWVYNNYTKWKVLMQREIKTRGFLKELAICCRDIPTSSKITPFCHLHSTDVFILACSKETVKPTELKYSLKESLFYVE